MFARPPPTACEDYCARGPEDNLILGLSLSGPLLGKLLQVGQVIVTTLSLLPTFMGLALERSPTGGEAQATGGWNGSLGLQWVLVLA